MEIKVMDVTAHLSERVVGAGRPWPSKKAAEKKGKIAKNRKKVEKNPRPKVHHQPPTNIPSNSVTSSPSLHSTLPPPSRWTML